VGAVTQKKSISELIEEARAQALRPEQSLLRMLAVRKLSIASLKEAHQNYEGAAMKIAEALKEIEGQ
jgi:hypothetical protein